MMDKLLIGTALLPLLALTLPLANAVQADCGYVTQAHSDDDSSFENTHTYCLAATYGSGVCLGYDENAGSTTTPSGGSSWDNVSCSNYIPLS